MRNLALALLDDDHGIPHAAWVLLWPILIHEHHEDIVRSIKIQDNRVFLTQERAKELRSE